MTGSRIAGATAVVEDRQAELNSFYDEVFGSASQERHINDEPMETTLASPDLSDDDVLDILRCARNGEKFVSLFDNADMSEYGDNWSVADMALVGLIAFYTQDRKQIDRLFRRSRLMRDKWDERRGTHPDGSAKTYGEVTIDAALRHRRESWQPGAASMIDDGIGDTSSNPGLAKDDARPVWSDRIVDAADMQRPDGEQPTLCGSYILPGAIHMVIGTRAIGKSTVVIGIACSIASGKSYYGLSCTRDRRPLHRYGERGSASSCQASSNVPRRIRRSWATLLRRSTSSASRRKSEACCRMPGKRDRTGCF